VFLHGHAEPVLYHDDPAARDEPIVHEDVDRLADLAVQLQHAAAAELEQLGDRHVRLAQHGREVHRHVEHGRQVAGGLVLAVVDRGQGGALGKFLERQVVVGGHQDPPSFVMARDSAWPASLARAAVSVSAIRSATAAGSKAARPSDHSRVKAATGMAGSSRKAIWPVKPASAQAASRSARTASSRPMLRTTRRGVACSSPPSAPIAAFSGACGKRSRAAPAMTRAAASDSSAEPSRWIWAERARAGRAWTTPSATTDRAWARRLATSARASSRASWRAAATSASTSAGV